MRSRLLEHPRATHKRLAIMIALCSPHLTSPHLTSPHLTSPHLTSPHLTSPHLTSPHLTSPHLTSPHLTSPHLTSPHLTPPHLTSPHLTSPHLTSPHLTSPHLTSPHLTRQAFLVPDGSTEARLYDPFPFTLLRGKSKSGPLLALRVRWHQCMLINFNKVRMQGVSIFPIPVVAHTCCMQLLMHLCSS